MCKASWCWEEPQVWRLIYLLNINQYLLNTDLFGCNAGVTLKKSVFCAHFPEHCSMELKWNLLLLPVEWAELSVPKPAAADGVTVLTSPSKGAAAQGGNCIVFRL